MDTQRQSGNLELLISDYQGSSDLLHKVAQNSLSKISSDPCFLAFVLAYIVRSFAKYNQNYLKRQNTYFK